MKNNHHANLIVGTSDEVKNFVRSNLSDSGFITTNNPDFIVLEVATFGIDEARELKRLSSKKAFSGEKVFLILPEKITLEAQNALLKTFEDPTPNTKFFLATREREFILPTLVSRMSVINIASNRAVGAASEFAALSLKSRLTFASKFADKEENLPAFLDSLMLFLEEKKDRKALKKVYRLKKLSGDRDIFSRLVIEHLSLVL